MIFGNDVSHWQIAINQDVAYARGARFKVNKSTDGNYYVDNLGISFHLASREKGMPSTLFHYFRTKAKGEDQFAHMKEVNDPHDLDLPVCIDCEDKEGLSSYYKPLITSRLQTLVRYLRGYKGFAYPMIYTNIGWWNEYILPWSGWAECPLMVADWGLHTIIPEGWQPPNGEPRLPYSWKDAGKDWMIWQIGRQKGSLWGAKSNLIDVDIWNENYPLPVISAPIPPEPPVDDPMSRVIVSLDEKTYKLTPL
jgi:GH25 family lysozyme M1 (1,4-beta-N-acetylmuramidase)